MASPGINVLRNFLAPLLVLCLVLPMQGHEDCHLSEGDLLFCCTDSLNAITDVTSGVEDLPIDHVAIVHRIGGEGGLLYVIEAIKPVVRLTPIDVFFSENPRLLVGRVNVDMDVSTSIRRCLSLVGKPYDDLYLPGDSAIYCSELVQMNFIDSRGNIIFDPIPMSFHDDSGQVTDYWLDFYAQRGMAVPEGEPGSNPGELSRRQQVTIIGKISVFGKCVKSDWYIR